MRSSIQKALIASAGFALGWIFCKATLEQQYQAALDADIDQVRDYYEKREEFTAKTERDEAWFAEQAVAHTADLLVSKYNTMSEPQLPWNPESKVVVTNSVIDENSDEPVVIPEWEFTQSISRYNQFQMYYFPESDELVNLELTRFDPGFRDKAVGAILTRFDDLRGDCPSLFVRCPSLEMEFEILRGEGPWENPELGDDG